MVASLEQWIAFIDILAALILPRVITAASRLTGYSSAVRTVTDAQYAILIDAGSSGSRLFVYTWKEQPRSDKQLPDITILKSDKGEEIVKKINPGLASYVNELEKVGPYISQLLDFATPNIPIAQHKETPIYIFATAGMRLLTESFSDQELIWSRVRTVIKEKYSFKFSSDDARTITGKEEALFGWITVNYLLGRFGYDTKAMKPLSTYGMLDMGGASMQIAFEITPNQAVPGNLFTHFSVTLSGTGKRLYYRTYLVSYLNFGANAMRSRYERLLLYELIRKSGPPVTSMPVKIQDTCLLKGLVLDIKDVVPRASDDFRPVGKTEATYHVQFVGGGKYENCEKAIKPLFNKRTDCSPLPCAVGERVQPTIDFQETDFYGMSEFYYALTDLANGSIYNHGLILGNLKELCLKDWQAYEAEVSKQNPGTPAEKMEEILGWKKLACFKATYVITMLHFGLMFPTDYSGLNIVTHLRQTDLQWSLGALFYMLYATPLDGQWPPYLIGTTCFLMLLLTTLVVTLVVFVIKRRRARAAKVYNDYEAQLTPVSTPITVIGRPNATAAGKLTPTLPSIGGS